VADRWYEAGRRLRAGLLGTARLGTALLGSPEARRRSERAWGAELARALESQQGRDEDPELAALLEELCARLAGRLREKSFAWRAAVLAGGPPNACALPGGFLYVSRALVDLCQGDPDELACVLGHEMAHVVRGHATDRLIGEKLIGALGAGLAARGGPLAQVVVQASAGFLTSAYSRDQEREADELGARLAKAAGYDPRAAIRMLSRFAQLEATSAAALGSYFASHPPTAERIENLTRVIDAQGGL